MKHFDKFSSSTIGCLLVCWLPLLENDLKDPEAEDKFDNDKELSTMVEPHHGRWVARYIPSYEVAYV